MGIQIDGEEENEDDKEELSGSFGFGTLWLLAAGAILIFLMLKYGIGGATK